MRLRTLSKTAKNQCVLGGHGNPQQFHTTGTSSQTPGSTMNRVRFAAAPRSAFSPFWIALVLVMAILSLASISLFAESANTYYKRGEAAEASENYDAAFDNYQKATQMAPKDLRYRTALVRVQLSASTLHVTKGHKLLQAGDVQGALGRVPPCHGDRSRQRGRPAGDCQNPRSREPGATHSREPAGDRPARSRKSIPSARPFACGRSPLSP